MSFNFTFGDISNQSILAFDPRCLIVATPEGTPSPPDVTSTAARPMMTQGLRKSVGISNFREKLRNVEIDEDLNDASYVQPSTKKTIQFQLKSDEENDHVRLFSIFCKVFYRFNNNLAL